MKKILGTYDIIGEYAKEFRLLEKFLYGISEMYNFFWNNHVFKKIANNHVSEKITQIIMFQMTP